LKLVSIASGLNHRLFCGILPATYSLVLVNLSVSILLSLIQANEPGTSVEAPELLLAVGGAWEPQELSQEIKATNPWPEAEWTAFYRHAETKSIVNLYKLANRLGQLEFTVFDFETRNLDGCFFVKSQLMELPALDESVKVKGRYRMIPVCWSENKNYWEWSLLEFIESENKNIFLAEYRAQSAPDFRVFAGAEKLFTQQLGLCRPSQVMECFNRIKRETIEAKALGPALSKSHPSVYVIQKSKATSEIVRASGARMLEFSEPQVSECRSARQSDIIDRVQQVAFNGLRSEGRECYFDLTKSRPEYVCDPKAVNSSRVVYSFFSSTSECEKYRFGFQDIAQAPPTPVEINPGEKPDKLSLPVNNDAKAEKSDPPQSPIPVAESPHSLDLERGRLMKPQF